MLDGKVAVVTGGAWGIELAICERLRRRMLFEANVRRCGIEYAITVSIGDGVWLGGPRHSLSRRCRGEYGGWCRERCYPGFARQTLSLPAVPCRVIRQL